MVKIVVQSEISYIFCSIYYQEIPIKCPYHTRHISCFPFSKMEEKAEKQNEVLEKTRSEVNEVIDTMTKTAEVLQDRSDKLGMTSLQLQEMEEGAKLLQRNSKQLADKMWFENAKMKIAFGVMIVIVVVIIIIIIIRESTKQS